MYTKWNKVRLSTPEKIASSFSRQPCSQGNHAHHPTAWMQYCCSSPTHKDKVFIRAPLESSSRSPNATLKCPTTLSKTYFDHSLPSATCNLS